MAENAYANATVPLERVTMNWSAIWAGVFSFIAIWSVFGLLGMAIFASSANPSAQEPVTGLNVGMAIWGIVLTIIAMYVAGRITGGLASPTTRHVGVNHGMVMFGLSVAATLVILALAGTAVSGVAGMNGAAHGTYLSGVSAGLGWTGFISLFLGWLAAMGGAATGSRPPRLNLGTRSEGENVHPMRPAA